MKAYNWESLRQATIGRQFPRAASLLELVAQLGPIQAQAPRAPYVFASSRLPGVTKAEIDEAYESLSLVRATSLRSTVHTSIREQHRYVDAIARATMGQLTKRTFKIDDDQLGEMRAELEQFTLDGWREPAELNEHMRGWFAERGWSQAEGYAFEQIGSALLRGHPALIRRPLTGGWHQQGRWGYRTSALVFSDDEQVSIDDALVSLVRIHIGSFGPVTRHDVSWWTGVGLRRVDWAVQQLGDEVATRPGPDGRDYVDLVSPRTGPRDPGLRLLPEYDGLLLGYAPGARLRFADQEAIDHAWKQVNGVFSPALCYDGKIRGSWKLVKDGKASLIEATIMPGERVPSEAEFEDQVAAVGLALDLTVASVRVVIA